MPHEIAPLQSSDFFQLVPKELFILHKSSTIENFTFHFDLLSRTRVNSNFVSEADAEKIAKEEEKRAFEERKKRKAK